MQDTVRVGSEVFHTLKELSDAGFQQASGMGWFAI